QCVFRLTPGQTTADTKPSTTAMAHAATPRSSVKAPTHFRKAKHTAQTTREKTTPWMRVHQSKAGPSRLPIGRIVARAAPRTRAGGPVARAPRRAKSPRLRAPRHPGPLDLDPDRDPRGARRRERAARHQEPEQVAARPARER